MKKRKQKRALLIGAISLAVLLLVFLITFLLMKNVVNKVPSNVIADHIFIDEVDVSGMKKKEAEEAVVAKLKEYQAQKITFLAEDVKKEVTLEDAGLQAKDIDQKVKEAVAYGKKGSIFSRFRKLSALKEDKPYRIELHFSVDSPRVKDTMENKMPALNNQAQNATIKRENGAFIVTEGKKGRKIEMEDSIKVVETFFQGNWKEQKNAKLELVTTVAEPDISKADLDKIQSALGSFSTSFTSTNSRGKNIKHASSKINGTVLMPGEEYSASTGMGSRNAENGYLEAGSYLDGQTVQTYGGGVCQVSSTLYNAVILAELEITERWSHSMTVDYVKPSMDAAISEGYKDLKFKNNTNAPIYIEGYTVGGKLTFTIYGEETRPATRKISFVSEVISKTAAKKKFVATGDAVGVLKKSVSGHDAVKAKCWKVITENGVEVERVEINSSSYQSSAATWSVGTGTDNAQAKGVLTSAISSQNEATIKSAIEQAKAIISAASQPAPTPPASGEGESATP